MSNLNLSGFPRLRINPSDVFGSWDDFIKEFDIAVQFKSATLGTKEITNAAEERVIVEVFGDNLKCLALYHSIGIEGMRVIESKGHNVRRNTLTYDQALDILQTHYGREESINVKTRNFVCASQQATEDDRDYLKRVEHLSRNLDYFKNVNAATHTALQTARESMTLVIAVNGLKDTNLRRELMATRTLTWETLSETLKCRSTATESAAKLDTPVSEFGRLNIKQEVAASSYYDNS